MTLTDDQWVNSIKMGVSKLTDIKDTAQRNRVIEMLTNREKALEDDKERYEYAIRNKVMASTQAETQIWQSFTNGDISTEEADTLINFIRNLDEKIKAEMAGRPSPLAEIFKPTQPGLWQFLKEKYPTWFQPIEREEGKLPWE